MLLLQLLPLFFKPGTVDELVDFLHLFATLLLAYLSIIIICHRLQGVNLPVDKFLVEGKKKIPNLVGTTFTHNNLMEMGVCIELEQHRFEVLHGYDEILISGLAMGAVAGVGSTYNYIPNGLSGYF